MLKNIVLLFVITIASIQCSFANESTRISENEDENHVYLSFLSGPGALSDHRSIRPVLGLSGGYLFNSNLSLGVYTRFTYFDDGFVDGTHNFEALFYGLEFSYLFRRNESDPHVDLRVGQIHSTETTSTTLLPIGSTWDTSFSAGVGAGYDFFLNRSLSLGGQLDYLFGDNRSGNGGNLFDFLAAFKVWF